MEQELWIIFLDSSFGLILFQGFVKACEELARHQKLLAEKRLTDETSDSESPGESENGPERMEEEEEEEDTSPLEVSSTSVSPMKKRICLKVRTLLHISETRERIKLPSSSFDLMIHMDQIEKRIDHYRNKKCFFYMPCKESLGNG